MDARSARLRWRVDRAIAAKRALPDSPAPAPHQSLRAARGVLRIFDTRPGEAYTTKAGIAFNFDFKANTAGKRHVPFAYRAGISVLRIPGRRHLCGRLAADCDLQPLLSIDGRNQNEPCCGLTRFRFSKMEPLSLPFPQRVGKGILFCDLDPRVADGFDLGQVFDVLTAELISVIPSGYFFPVHRRYGAGRWPEGLRREGERLGRRVVSPIPPVKDRFSEPQSVVQS